MTSTYYHHHHRHHHHNYHHHYYYRQGIANFRTNSSLGFVSVYEAYRLVQFNLCNECTMTKGLIISMTGNCHPSLAYSLSLHLFFFFSLATWQTILMYLGIALGVVVIIVIIAVVIHKKQQRNHVEVIVVKDEDPHDDRPIFGRGGRERPSPFGQPVGAPPASGMLPSQPPRQPRPYGGPPPPGFNRPMGLGGLGGIAPIDE